MTGCDARKITEARGGKFEVAPTIGMIGDLVDVGEGGKMRHMGNSGKNGIVFFRAHTESLRPDCLPQVFNQAGSLFIFFAVRRDHQLPILKQSELRGKRAAPVRAGNRMGSDAMGQMFGQDAAKSLNGRLFGTAHIGNHGMRVQIRSDGAADVRKCGNRRSDNGQIRFVHTQSVNLRVGAIDDAPFKRTVKVVTIQIDAGYRIDQSEPFQVQHERASDQPDTDKDDVFECIHSRYAGQRSSENGTPAILGINCPHSIVSERQTHIGNDTASRTIRPTIKRQFAIVPFRFTIGRQKSIRRKQTMSLAQPKRILVIKLRHHGDVLLATPVVHALKTRFPDCEIDMLVYRETTDIISDNPEIAEIFTIDRSWKKQGLKTQLSEEKKLFSRLKKRWYDWAFNLSDQWRAAILAKFCAQCSVGISHIKRDRFFWRWCHDFLNPEAGRGCHITEYHMNVLPPLIRPEETPPVKVMMVIGDDSRSNLQSKLQEQGWNGEDYVLFHPGARWEFKCWEDGKNAAIVQLLLNHGQNVVLTAAPSATEQQMVDAVVERVKIPEGGKLWILSGDLNLRELAAAIDGCKLFIGVDSAPMHIAAALDKPQIALFGPSWLDRWHPYSDNAEVIWAGDFGDLPHPDSINTSDNTRLLKAIPLEAVWNKIAEKLGLNKET